jgi:dephospho-CoA kinase
MYLVGLTGGIGSGKSTVAARLAEHGVPVVDADQVAREVVEPGEAALEEIAAHFGRDVLTPDGALDRPALARLAFVDDEQRAALDGIMHPRIYERIVERVTELAEGRAPLVVVDHPLLLETDQAATFDAVVVVLAPEEVRVRRLVEHRGLDEQDVRARMRAQTDDETRRRLADHAIENAGDVEELRRRADAILDELRRAARAVGDGTSA